MSREAILLRLREQLDATSKHSPSRPYCTPEVDVSDLANCEIPTSANIGQWKLTLHSVHVNQSTESVEIAFYHARKIIP